MRLPGRVDDLAQEHGQQVQAALLASGSEL
jgi:hypothetical protein